MMRRAIWILLMVSGLCVIAQQDRRRAWKLPAGALVFFEFYSELGVTTNVTTVSAWGDQTGNGRNMIQTNSSFQPLIVTNQLDGFPAIRFDGADNKLAIPQFTYQSNGTICAVIKLNTSGTTMPVWGGNIITANPSFAFYVLSSQKWSSQNGNSLDTVANAPLTVVFVASTYTSTPSVTNIIVQGATVLATGNNGSNAWELFSMGEDNNGAYGALDVFAVRAYNRVLGTNEIQAIHEQWQIKYPSLP